jgi:hypothetical protein
VCESLLLQVPLEVRGTIGVVYKQEKKKIIKRQETDFSFINLIGKKIPAFSNL